MFDNGAVKKNRHFMNGGRAAYELGQLLRTLPSEFSSDSTVLPDALLRADAARCHARNANNTILFGLEAIGELLFVASSAKNNDVDKSSVASLGCLIQHLAVEAQFLQSIEDELSFEIGEQNKHAVAAAPGGKDA